MQFPPKYPQSIINSQKKVTPYIKLRQDGHKSFEALIGPKSLAPTILINSDNFQGHAGRNKMYSLIKTDVF